MTSAAAVSERGPDRRADRVSELGRRPAAHGERGQHPERPAAQQHGEDQVAEVGGDPVARLLADAVDVDPVAGRDLLDGVAVDRAQVDAQPRRQPDRLEARAPVHERHVDVERALVAGGDAELDRADAERAVLAEADQREVAAGQRREDDRGDRRDPQERARKSLSAFVVDQKASSCHGISSGAKASTCSASGVVLRLLVDLGRENDEHHALLRARVDPD